MDPVEGIGGGILGTLCSEPFLKVVEGCCGCLGSVWVKGGNFLCLILTLLNTSIYMLNTARGNRLG